MHVRSSIALNARFSPAALPAGHVLFQKVRVLEVGELHGEAVVEVAHHPARGLADGDRGADLGPLLGGDGRA